jgi:hypothetical protein
MKNLLRIAGAATLALLASPASPQSFIPNCRNAGGSYIPCDPVVLVDKTGTIIDSTNPLPVSGGGGGATTIANGADTAQGSTGDAAYSDAAGIASGTVIALLKGMYASQRVMGMSAVGAAPSGYPMFVAGTDGGVIRALRLDGNGRLQGTWYTSGGQEISYRNDNTNNVAPTSANTMPAFISRQTVFDGSRWQFAAGDIYGAWSHAPQSTPAPSGGTIAASGGTAALVFTNITDGEVMNPSTAVLWASWGTPAVNGAGSFAIQPNGSYRPPSRVAGTLTLLSTATNQTYTFNKF